MTNINFSARRFARTPRSIVSCCAIALCHHALAPAAFAIVPSEFDAYETGTTLYWQTFGSAAGLRVVEDCASGSACLEHRTGPSAPARRPVVFNQKQWAGDYSQAGVSGVEVWLHNTGSEPLFVRVGVTNDADGAGSSSYGTCYVSHVALELNPGEAMTHKFALRGAALALAFDGANCGDTGSRSDVISNVTQLRIFTSRTTKWVPDVVDAQLAIDNVAALGWDPIYGGDEA